jgi:hypothetical protein
MKVLREMCLSILIAVFLLSGFTYAQNPAEESCRDKGVVSVTTTFEMKDGETIYTPVYTWKYEGKEIALGQKLEVDVKCEDGVVRHFVVEEFEKFDNDKQVMFVARNRIEDKALLNKEAVICNHTCEFDPNQGPINELYHGLGKCFSLEGGAIYGLSNNQDIGGHKGVVFLYSGRTEVKKFILLNGNWLSKTGNTYRIEHGTGYVITDSGTERWTR